MMGELQSTALYGELRELFGRTAYSHKTHAKMADWPDRWHRFWYWSDVILIAVGATGSITSVANAFPDPGPKIAGVVGAIANCGALAVTLYTLKSDAERRVTKHRDAENELWKVREQFVSIMSDLHDGVMSVEDARTVRDELIDRLKAIYNIAPQTNGKAYEAAQRALKSDEELTFSDKELDVMLHGALRSVSPDTSVPTSGSSLNPPSD